MTTVFNKYFRLLRSNFSPFWFLVIFLILLVSVVLLWVQPDSLIGKSSKSIFIVGLFNFNLILFVALLFVVGRNLLRLVFERKNKVFGSKLRQRLVLAFLMLTLVPVMIMFFLASGLIQRASSNWFGEQVESVVDNAMNISQIYIDQEKENLREIGKQIVNILENNPLVTKDAETLDRFVRDLRNRYRLTSIRFFDQNNLSVFEAHSPTNKINDLSEPKLNVDFNSEMIEEKIKLEDTSGLQFVRFYKTSVINEQQGTLIITKPINSEVSGSLTAVNRGYKEYGQLKIYQTPLTASYLISLAMITGILILSAIWLGFFLAKEISDPINKLSQATREIAKGNYSQLIATGGGDDEISRLVKSFNQMSGDLESSTTELEQRKNYIETILNNLAVGVIGLDPMLSVTTLNYAVLTILNIKDPDQYLNKPVADLLTNYPELNKHALAEESSGETVQQEEVDLLVDGEEKKLIITTGDVLDEEMSSRGKVILLDDISDLVKAQKVSAWREVAKKLAHEIKNPLTPIKLSAQRLKKSFSKLNEENIEKISDTIVENVNVIKVLLDEFSSFARLPQIQLQDSDLNQFIVNVVQDFRSYEVEILTELENDLPLVRIDHHQFRRCLLNLIENAVLALEDYSGNTRTGQVLVKTMSDDQHVLISIEDNGPGISEEHKNKVFEPYYTTRQEGTGLGLSIVSTIINEHHGSIKLHSESGQGTAFTILLPRYS